MGSVRGEQWGQAIDQLDRACTNVDDQMMLVQPCSRDCGVSGRETFFFWGTE